MTKNLLTTIGILGDGQLARMLSLAAYPLNIHTLALSLSDTSQGHGVTPLCTGSMNNLSDLKQFCAQVDIITFETENIPLEIAKICSQRKNFQPSADILKVAQDRLLEKELFTQLQIPTTHYFSIESKNDLTQALNKVGFPAVLKTRRMGYDGKGQAIIYDMPSAYSAFENLKEQELILESFIKFDMEVSIIAVRNSYESKFYPLTKNEHQNGILFCSQPLPKNHSLHPHAEKYAQLILEHFNYKGCFALEFFVRGDQLIANEMAPRVHNSGHWTIEGSYTSQFENHIRAILDLPLGNCEARSLAAMINCVGSIPQKQVILAEKNVHLHDYGKAPRQNRKLGHITLIGENSALFAQQLQRLKELIQINQDYSKINF